MKIPFSTDEFLTVFENYNTSLWPVQVFFYLLAVVAIILVIKNGQQSNRIVFAILAFFWFWMGLVYHILYFSATNKAAYLFGVVFIVQGILFLFQGSIRQNIQLKFDLNLSGVIGVVLIVYALLIYPALGYLMGHVYPRTPTFGVPCPTTIFTFGMLLFSANRVRWFIVFIPLLWSVVGFSAANSLSIKEDFGLVIAGILSAFLLLIYNPRHQTNV